MREITFLLFDLDGTIMNTKSATLTSFAYALEKLGRPAPAMKDLTWCMGPPLRECFAVLLDSLDPYLLEQAVVLFREEHARCGKFASILYPGIAKALAFLKRLGYIMFIVTTQPTLAAHEIIHHFGLIDYFNRIYGSEFDGRRSDKRDLIRYVLDQELLSPDKTMMFGDRKYDIVGAKYNNICAGGITYGYGSIEELTLAGADYLFDHPYEIARFLASHKRER